MSFLVFKILFTVVSADFYINFIIRAIPIF